MDEKINCYLKVGFRIVLGLMFVVFGVNGMLSFFGHGFIPMEPPPPESKAMMFFSGLMAIKNYVSG